MAKSKEIMEMSTPMTLLGSSFRGHQSLTYGFADDDGAFFIEYRKGSKFSKSKGVELIKKLSSKLRYELRENKPMHCKFDIDEFEEKIIYWMDTVKTHMERRYYKDFENKNLGDSPDG